MGDEVQQILAGVRDITRRTTVGIGVGAMRAPIWDLAQYSPQLALARALGVQLAPILYNIRATFEDSTPTTNPASFDGATNDSGNVSFSQPSIIDQITYTITAPNAFSGNVFKSMSDFFYEKVSGIEATLNVTGAPRYTVAPYMTPIDSLLSSLAEGWPCGWVMGYTQSIIMTFQQRIPVPTFPTDVTVTFRVWQPVGTDDFQMMSSETARNSLAAFGIQTPTPVPAAGVAGLPPNLQALLARSR